MHVRADGTFATAAVDVPAGGWLRLELELLDSAGLTVAEAVVEPIAIGEVFLVAGQSYSVSCHEELTVVADRAGRAAATSVEEAGWRLAHDPQPEVRTRLGGTVEREVVALLAGLDLRFPLGELSPFRGSVWPTFADALIRTEDVPVGLVNVGVGATSIRHWTPGEQLFANLVDAARLAGDIRAVLWQQGESDVHAGTTSDEYARQLLAMRAAFVDDTGLDRPWLPAKSTHHPTSGGDERLESAVRSAIDGVWREPGFFPGPDTDRLRGSEHRAEWWRGAHFTGAGQRAAGRMWAERVCALLTDVGDELAHPSRQPSPRRPAVVDRASEPQHVPVDARMNGTNRAAARTGEE